MRFEWDRSKATSNLKKHRVSFDEGVTVFYDPLAATFRDPDHSHDESQLVTVGYIAPADFSSCVMLSEAGSYA